jgi:hypothetical protein
MTASVREQEELVFPRALRLVGSLARGEAASGKRTFLARSSRSPIFE